MSSVSLIILNTYLMRYLIYLIKEVKQMKTLGSRIRMRRQQKQLTLVQLAGEQMTKGMLSLIENDKAKPSIENLHYLADALDTSVSELLGETEDEEIQLLMRIEETIRATDSLRANAQEIVNLVPKEFSFSERFSGGRLAYHVAVARTIEQQDSLVQFVHAEDVFKRLQAIDEWMDTIMMQVKLKLFHGAFEEAANVLKQKEADIRQFIMQPKPMKQLEWWHTEALLYAAIGEFSRSLACIERMITFGNKNHMYYLMNEQLRMALANSIIQFDLETFYHYLRKAQSYSAFSEDKDFKHFLWLVQMHIHTTFEVDVARALHFYHQLIEDTPGEIYQGFLHLEYGKTLFLQGKEQLALQELKKVALDPALAHPIDQLMLASTYTYQIKIAKRLKDPILLSEATYEGKLLYQKLPESVYSTQFWNEIGGKE